MEQPEDKTDLKACLAGQHILLVEDNPMLQEMTALTLNKDEAMVDVADNGQQALQLTEKNNYDLVITDLFMPEMDGFELITQLRASGFDRPVFVVSAATVGEENNRALDLGATAALPKPFNIRLLRQAMADIQNSSDTP